MRVAIAGSSGFIGSHLRSALEADGVSITSLVRKESGEDQLLIDDDLSLEGFDAVVNLAGHPIGARRLTDKEKQKILSSRVNSTDLIAKAVARCQTKPDLINASAVGFYGKNRSEHLTEESLPGSGFLTSVVRAWEHATLPATNAEARVVMVRTGIVVGRGGGILKRLLPIFKLGLGGRLSNGNQMMSWISITDEIAAIKHCISNKSIAGPVNLTAPNPVTNKEFTRALASAVHRPAFLPVPKLAIDLMLGREIGDDFTGSQEVLPTKLLNSGFSFTHSEIEKALADILAK